jgi:hypothetical protein
MDKEKSTGLNRFVIVCKAYVAKTPLPKGSGNFFDDSTSGLPRRAQQVVLIVDNVELGIRPN